MSLPPLHSTSLHRRILRLHQEAVNNFFDFFCGGPRIVRSRGSCTSRSGRTAYPRDRLSTASLLRRTRRVPTRWLHLRRSVVRWDAMITADCQLRIADWKLEAKIQLGCARMERATVIEQPADEKMFRWLRMMARMIRFELPAANPSPNRSKIVCEWALTKK